MLDEAVRTLAPQSADEIVALVAESGAAGRRIEVMGAGTKRGIGAVGGVDTVISTRALDRVIDYQPGELTLTVQPGVPLSDIEAMLAAQGQMLPFEPPSWTRLLAVGGAPTIGGTVVANLSGPRRIRAGGARDHLLGFQAVSGRGELFKAGGKVVKNVTGYDLMKLMAGSWGTLAILTELTLKVLPAPRTQRTLALGGLSDARATQAMTLAMNGPFEVSAACHRPGLHTAIRLEGFEASVTARTQALAAALADFGPTEVLEAEASAALWRSVRDVEPFVGDTRPLWRISLPPAQGWRLAGSLPGDVLYDWAGGLVWLASDAPSDQVRSAVAELGGHALALRGAAAFGRRTGPLAALEARVKAAFDPLGVLNPGRMDG